MEYGRLFIADPDEEREDALKQIIADLLVELGADMTDLNFQKTPRRTARAWIEEFTIEPFTWSHFDEEPYSGAITLSNHTVWTRCPHHLERVRMEVSISYIPAEGRVLGLSKLARAADFFATGCVLQETYTRLLVEGIVENLAPKGVAVLTRAEHNCMQARGVETGGPVIMDLYDGDYTSPQMQQKFLEYTRK